MPQLVGPSPNQVLTHAARAKGSGQSKLGPISKVYVGNYEKIDLVNKHFLLNCLRFSGFVVKTIIKKNVERSRAAR